MSQYPQPYYQQPYGQPPVDYSHYVSPGDADLLGPARRASILQGILGGLMLLCGGVIVALPHFVNVAEIMAASGQQMPELPPGWTMQQAMALGLGMLGGCGAILGLTLLVLCVPVRSASRAAVIASMIVTGVVLLMLGIRLIAGVVQVVTNPAAILDLLMAVVLAGLFGLNMYWLAAAARKAGRIAMARQQYQAQFYMHQQQQQAYGQPAYGMPGAPPPPGYGYGYGYAPPPPPSFGPAGQAQPQAQQPPQPASPPGPTPTPPPTGGPDGPTPPPAAG